MEVFLHKIKTTSPEQTKNFAKKIGKILTNGDIIILEGELGCGKTIFAKGIGEFYKVKKKVKSPSFSILNIYPAKKYFIYHFDFFRINNKEEQLNIFLEHYPKDGIFVAEWGEKIKNEFEQYLALKFIKLKNVNHREMFFYSSQKSKWKEKLRKILC